MSIYFADDREPVGSGSRAVQIGRLRDDVLVDVEDCVAVEEPLAIELVHGPDGQRELKALSVTMRTPGADEKLAVGFLLTEGIIRDAEDVDEVRMMGANTVRVALASDVILNMATVERNFYMTSSCGVCGKASLLALETFCPPRRQNNFTMEAAALYSLPAALRESQALFHSTGGLHAAGLFDAQGGLLCVEEDIGRHNAFDKVIGGRVLAGEVPLRDAMVLFSGRASFELLQKAVMAGVPMVASVGAPSSLAVSIARRFDVTLVGFLHESHCNIYEGRSRVTGIGGSADFELEAGSPFSV